MDNINLKFFLLPTLTSFDAILGNNSLKLLNAQICLKENWLIINDKNKMRIFQHECPSVNKIEVDLSHLKESTEQQLKNIIQNHAALFAEPDEKLPFTTKVVATIRTTDNEPVFTRSYPYPQALKSEVEQQIQELIDNNIIRPSRSPYNSPVHIVRKKDDKEGKKQYRLVIDFRKLNSVTIADKYPIPSIEDTLANLGEAKYFTTLDLKSGFHQIPMSEDDIEKTAFSVNNGKFEFLRLPFGLKNAPSIFQRALDDVLRDFIGRFCFVYIDDIIIFSTDEKSHLQHISKIFQALTEANFKAELKKCSFFKESVEFLGFVVTADGIKTCPKKVQAIKDFRKPETLKEPFSAAAALGSM